VRARAHVTAGVEVGCLTIPDQGAWLFDSDRHGLPQWRELPPDGQGRILEAVTAALSARHVLASAPLNITLDSRAFRTNRPGGGQEKLGLGSSAAITVALSAALLACIGRETADRTALAEIGFDAHRRFQSGSGSGIDIATSVHGGVVAFSATESGRDVRPLAWPTGLHWLAVWSGTSAATPEMLARFDAFRVSDSDRYSRQVGELRLLAQSVLSAWERAEVKTILRAMADYDDALRALDDGAGIGIYTSAHNRHARLAQECGAVYKVSGAGGGDFGIAFADSAAAIAGMRSRLAGEGVLTLPGSADVPGVEVGVSTATAH